MKTQSLKLGRLRANSSWRPLLGGQLLLLMLCTTFSAIAQPATNASAPGVTSSGKVTTPFRYGRIMAHPFATYTYSYNDGIQVVPGQAGDTETASYAAGVALVFGARWNLDYTATYNQNSNSDFRDAWTQNLQFRGSLMGRDWLMRTEHKYQSLVSSLIETGRETAEETVSSTVEIMRPFSSEISLQSSLATNLRFIETLPDIHDFSTTQALSYRVSPRADIGLAVQAGYSAVYKAADMVFVSPLFQFQWRPGAKLDIMLHAGYQHQVLVSEAGGESNSPVFGSTVSYRPFEFTTFSIEGTRAIGTSLLSGQINKSRGWTARLEQRIFKYFSITASGTRGTANYISVSPDDETVNRNDSLESFDLRLNTTFLRRGSLSVTYGETHNKSSDRLFNASTRHTGVEVSFRY